MAVHRRREEFPKVRKRGNAQENGNAEGLEMKQKGAEARREGGCNRLMALYSLREKDPPGAGDHRGSAENQFWVSGC